MNENKTKIIIYPIVFTTYDRQYFVSNNSSSKAAVDYNLKSNYIKNLSQIYKKKKFFFLYS